MLTLLLQSVALTGGTVHTMVPGRPPERATVLVERDRIRAVGPDLALPEDAKVVDVAGKHVVPGLVDGMVNLDADHDVLYLSHGVTLVRDVGNDLVQVLAERDALARDRNPGPAIWAAGAVLDGPKPSTTSAVVLATPAEVDEKLPRIFDLDVDYLSFHLGLPQDAWRRVIEVAHAHQRRFQVWGPVPRGASLAEAAAAGQDGLFHLDGFLPPDVVWDQLDVATLDPLIDRVAGAKLAVTPGLAVYAQQVVSPKESRPELAYLGPIYVTSWLVELEGRKHFYGGKPELVERALKALQAQGALVARLHARGVPLVPGSGSPNPWMFPGDALIDELEMWRRAGIPDPAVLRMATAGAAAALGERERGTIEAGKVADLVVLGDDPSADVSNLREVEHVVVRGRHLARADLDALRERLSLAQKQRQALAFKPLEIAPPQPPIGELLLSGTVETRALGQRVSGESFAVTRKSDGTTVYQGHMKTLGWVTTADTDVELSQTVSDDEGLTAFSIVVRSGPRTITIEGVRSGSAMNIERRYDGTFVDNVPVKDRLALVDVQSVTTALILGRHVKEGRFKVVYLEDFDPATATWELRLDPDGTHLLRTQAGAIKASLDARGAPTSVQREQGRGVLETKLLSCAVGVEGGLALPESKRRPASAPAAEGPK